MACHGEVEGTGIGIRKLVLVVLASAFARCMTDKLFALVFFFLQNRFKNISPACLRGLL